MSLFTPFFVLLPNMWWTPTTEEVVKYFRTHDKNTKERHFVILNMLLGQVLFSLTLRRLKNADWKSSFSKIKANVSSFKISNQVFLLHSFFSVFCSGYKENFLILESIEVKGEPSSLNDIHVVKRRFSHLFKYSGDSLETATGGGWKKMLKILQNSQEEETPTQVFSVNFGKFLWTPIL